MSVFPMLGVEGYAHRADPLGPVAASRLVSDRVINQNPRFGALTQNIRERRGSTVSITAPLEDGRGTTEMDAMAFGMGCCCLQITMQCQSERESRFLHDQLAVLAPLFLAVSAATPIAHGRLLNTDSRWDIISQAVDDRTPAERGLEVGSEPSPELVGCGVRRLSKSRYSSVSRFIAECEGSEETARLDALNDLPQELDEEALNLCLAGGLDRQLAAHLAHLFVRDPLVIFNDSVYLDDQRRTDHFENVQSTNWRTVRWKLPAMRTADSLQSRLKAGLTAKQSNAIGYSDPGWRVEFRPLEVQLTDFENAALSILVVLAARSLLAMGYNFYLPMSLVDENMRRAQTKDAVLCQKFFVRKRALDPSTSQLTVPEVRDEDITEMTLDEFFNGGRDSGFPGLIPAVLGYLEAVGCNSLVRGRFLPYLSILQKRAAGELPTAAHWIRKFVKEHNDYRGDGVLTPEIADDLIRVCDDVGMGRVSRPDLHGDIFIRPLQRDDPYVDNCEESSATCSASSRLPQSYTPRSYCSAGNAFSVLSGSGPEPDTYLDTVI